MERGLNAYVNFYGPRAGYTVGQKVLAIEWYIIAETMPLAFLLSLDFLLRPETCHFAVS